MEGIITKNQLLRRDFCSSGKCMAMWCSDRSIHGNCRSSSYNECEIFKALEKEIKMESEGE